MRKRQPHPEVVRWFADRAPDSLYLSVLTLGELRKGIEAMAAGARRDALLEWLEHELPQYFAGRILPIHAHVADLWGKLCATAERPLPAIDSLLAATAMAEGLTLVTRNVDDFSFPGLRVVNPWKAGANA